MWLEFSLIEEETWKANFQMDQHKAMDLDGFSLAFYLDCWSTQKKHFLLAFNNGIINKSTNSTSILFVPKTAFITSGFH